MRLFLWTAGQIWYVPEFHKRKNFTKEKTMKKNDEGKSDENDIHAPRGRACCRLRHYNP